MMMPRETAYSKGDCNRVRDMATFRRNFEAIKRRRRSPFKPGRYVLVGGKLVPLTAENAALTRKYDAHHLRSLSMGVLPEQAEEAERDMAARGVSGVKFCRKTGCMLLKNRSMQLSAAKALGMHGLDEVRG